MANEKLTLLCPACGVSVLRVLDYESIMVLRPNMALFTLRCNHCNRKISVFLPIPSILRQEIDMAARDVGAGMGNFVEN